MPVGRRRVAGAAVALAVLLLTLAACTSSRSHRPHPFATAGVADRPNIVFVLTDDLSWNLVKYLPHVRALQRDGTTMANYYTVDSLCCPSRSAIFTGEYPHDDGVFTNHGRDGGYGAFNRNGNEPKSFAVVLQRAGYRTALLGKYLNDYQTPDPPAPGWDVWAAAGNAYREFDYTLRENAAVDYYGRTSDAYLTDVLARRAGAFIQSSAAARTPFLLEVSTYAPHQPYVPAPRDADRFAGLTYPRTPAYDARPTPAPRWLPAAPLTRTERVGIDTDFRRRAQSVLAVDDLIAHVENELAANGLARSTYIVFSSDNGYHMGEYRLAPGKQTAYDTDIHVPLIVSGPDVPAGVTLRQLASNVDLAPTFTTLAGLPVRPGTDGVSLDQLWHGRPPPRWQRAVLVEHHGPNTSPDDPDRATRRSGNPPSYEAVRTADALYVRYVDGEQQYFDTRADPYELHDLAGSGVPAALPRTLLALQKCHATAQCQAAAGA